MNGGSSRGNPGLPQSKWMWGISGLSGSAAAVLAFWPARNSPSALPSFLWEGSYPVTLLMISLVAISSVAFSIGVMGTALSKGGKYWEPGLLGSGVAFGFGVGLWVITWVFGARAGADPGETVAQVYPQPEFLAGWGFLSLILIGVFRTLSVRHGWAATCPPLPD
jgi:hypothetical protein